MRRERVQPSRTRWREAARGASGPGAGAAAAAADWPLPRPCHCPSRASVHPRSMEQAAIGSLGTGTGAGYSWTGRSGAESGAC